MILSFFVFAIFTQCRYEARSRSSETTETKVTSRTKTRSKKSSKRISSGNRIVIKMNKKHGVYHVPCKINGTEMEFIFDTGASDITISATEAIFLIKQGKLIEEDILGTREYQIADGSIHEGTIINLRTVEIGNRKLENVHASIVDNMEAPLLLGQSALSKFGKISIDYNKNEIIFE